MFDVETDCNQGRTGLEGRIDVLGEKKKGLVCATVRAEAELSGGKNGDQDAIEGSGE